jgi:hypothetical protein
MFNMSRGAGSYIAYALQHAGMPDAVVSHSRSRDYKYPKWDLKKLQTDKLPTPTQQTAALAQMINNNENSTIVQMIKSVATGSEENPWRPCAFFIGMYGLHDETKDTMNIYSNARIFFDHSRPQITIGRSQSIDCRTNIQTKKRECRVNPFHVSVFRHLQAKRAQGEPAVEKK